MQYDINKFIDAQKTSHNRVISELKNEYKESHWMWFTFPQIAELGYSEVSRYYAIHNRVELQEFVSNQYLLDNLIECISVLLNTSTNNPIAIFGELDALKLQSSMTLFRNVAILHDICDRVLIKFFDGTIDLNTYTIMRTRKEWEV